MSNDADSATNVGPLLTRANLARMRGQWHEAADLCIEVLRLEPRSATAHSLLGDIYQDQGKPEEARHWYQLALELDPGSKADRAKLVRTEEVLEARQQRSEWESVIEGRSQPVATSLLVRESLQRIGALAGAALCGIFLIMATIVSLYDRSPVREGDAGPSIPLLRPHTGSVTETPQEQALRQKLNAVSGGSAQAVHVETDPRKRTGSVRVLLQGGRKSRMTTFDYRAQIMREGYRYAQALLRQDDTLTTLEVRVVGEVPSGVGGPTLLFLGTLPRENLVVGPDRISPQELQQFYGAVSPPYWAPELAVL